VAKFEYFRTTVTNQNCIHKEIKSRLHLGNACYHSVQRTLSSHFLSKILKSKIYKTIVKHGPLTQWEEHTLRVFENSVLRRIFGPKREEVAGG
jgi:hypothetical protein